MNPADRDAIDGLLQTPEFRRAQEVLRNACVITLFIALGGDWNKIHNEYGMYTINCRAKLDRRTISKCERLPDVSVANFYRRVPDLVGARLVVVDPDDLFRLAEEIRVGCLEPTFLQARSATITRTGPVWAFRDE
ncbi:MAG TPA: hypothetical protein VN924_28140 [Bryobacteraceae bacterium]|nr:hypothetical protein [Bryobacteraceae bacterium]